MATVEDGAWTREFGQQSLPATNAGHWCAQQNRKLVLTVNTSVPVGIGWLTRRVVHSPLARAPQLVALRPSLSGMPASRVFARRWSTQARACVYLFSVTLAAAQLLVVPPTASTAWATTTMETGQATAQTRPQLQWPLRSANGDPATVVRQFSVGGQRWSPGHRGLDLVGLPGQTVLSAAAGSITFAGVVAGIPVVVVNHGSTRTTYQPVLATMPVGAWVTPGRPIGTLTSVGSHCLPRTCLHFGLIEGETYLDPALLMPWPVRLLSTSSEGEKRHWFGGGLG